MKVEFWGAAQTVTGSMHLLHYAGKKILLDCGLYQGKRKDAFHRNRDFPFDPRSIDLVILSHAHIDHSGNLPSLVKAGYRGPIYCTSATRDLCSILLIDSAKIQESDVRFVNKRRLAEGKNPFEPLYEVADAMATIKRFRTVEFANPFSPLTGVTVQFYEAGHMLGAASVELVLAPEDRQGREIRLCFSGDIGRPGMPILRDPQIVPDVEYLIMESTYGSRLHEKGTDTGTVLLDAVSEIHQTGGRLIIPAFSVGRTQELVYRLNLLSLEGKLPPVKFFVDSPLAVDATEIYRSHVDCFNEEMIELMLGDEDRNPLSFPNLHYIRKPEHSMALNHFKEPCVIISASGMCEGGRVLHHLRHSISKPNTIILFAGYQAPDTLGRILLEQSRDEVKLYGEPFPVRAQVRKLNGCSGHADQQELVKWARQTAELGNLKNVALVHGELEPSSDLKKELLALGIPSVIIPARGNEMQLK